MDVGCLVDHLCYRDNHTRVGAIGVYPICLTNLLTWNSSIKWGLASLRVHALLLGTAKTLLSLLSWGKRDSLLASDFYLLFVALDRYQ